MLSRREMLTVLVGAPIAALACERYKPRAYAGRIVGGNKSFGHRVLDSSIEATGAATEEVEIAIVGAGPVGMAALLTSQFYTPAEIIVIDQDDNRLASGVLRQHHRHSLLQQRTLTFQQPHLVRVAHKV